VTVTDSSDPSHADPVRAAAEQRRGEMAVIWLLYAEAAACDPGEARGYFYGRAVCAELSKFLTSPRLFWLHPQVRRGGRL